MPDTTDTTMTELDPADDQLYRRTNTMADLSRRSTMEMVYDYDPDDDPLAQFVANRQTQATLQRWEA